MTESPLPSDELRALITGERTMASVGFSANVQPNGFWVRVTGTRMPAEANPFESPRLIVRHLWQGPRPLTSLVDGIAESSAVLSGSGRGL